MWSRPDAVIGAVARGASAPWRAHTTRAVCDWVCFSAPRWRAATVTRHH